MADDVCFVGLPWGRRYIRDADGGEELDDEWADPWEYTKLAGSSECLASKTACDPTCPRSMLSTGGRRSAKGGEDGDKPSKARKGHKAKLWKAVTKG